MAALLAIWPSTAFAIDQADTFTMLSARAYGQAIETGDILLVIHYDIDYVVIPSETAEQAFLGHYADASASPTQRVSTSPRVQVNSGYGQGVMSLYMSRAEVTSFGITWADGDAAQIAGNPAFFADPQLLNLLIEWRAETDSATILENDIRDIANILEVQTEWSGVDLISDQTLTDTGEDYFVNSIPNLRTMAPDLFVGSLGAPAFIERTHGSSYQDALNEFWVGSALEDNWDSLADWWNLPVNMVTSMAVITLAVIVGAWAQRTSGESLVTLPAMGVVLIGGTLVDWVPLQFTAVLGFFGLLVISYALWLKRASA